MSIDANSSVYGTIKGLCYRVNLTKLKLFEGPQETTVSITGRLPVNFFDDLTRVLVVLRGERLLAEFSINTNDEHASVTYRVPLSENPSAKSVLKQLGVDATETTSTVPKGMRQTKKKKS